MVFLGLVELITECQCFVCLFVMYFYFFQERDRILSTKKSEEKEECRTDPGSSGGFFGGLLKKFKTDMPKRGTVTCSYSLTSPILIPFLPSPFQMQMVYIALYYPACAKAIRDYVIDIIYVHMFSVLPRIFLRDRGYFFLVVLTGFNHKMGGGQK